MDGLIKLLGEERIEKVYSVFHLEDFFGVPAHWFATHGDEYSGENNKIECWIEYESIDEGSYEEEILRDAGVKVKFYTEINFDLL